MERPYPTRRAVLASVGTLGGVALAGCLGGPDAEDEGDCEGEQRTIDVPPLGDPDSTVTVATYTDFSCGHCGSYHESTFPEVKAEFVETGEIRYEHHDFPFIDEWSWKVPNAALAVLEGTDGDAYFAFVTGAFEYQGDYSTDVLADLGADLGADPDYVREAVDDEPFCEQLTEIRATGDDRGVDATPTVFVNDRKLEDWSAENVAEAIAAER